MSEQKLQSKILKWLKSEGHYAFKTITCNRNGIPDIIGCTGPTSSRPGRFFAIEVKWGVNKPSKLQEWNVAAIKERQGIALVAWSLEEVQKALS